MTEPDVASSDATNIDTRIVADGDSYVVSGRKWWSTGALREECRLAIVMGVSDPDADRHARHSMILVPLDAAGVTVHRSTTVFGYDDGPHGGHGEIGFDDVRVPAGNLLGPRGGGFAMAQARLGPGRIHHCMRSLGMAERALELMVARALDRHAFGGPLAGQGVVREWIAESRLAIEQARLLVLKAAWLIDTVGVKQAATEIAAIKVAAPRAASYVLDRAIQTFGAAGVSGDTPLAQLWAGLRTLHLADGPDEVHLRSVARVELAQGPGPMTGGWGITLPLPGLALPEQAELVRALPGWGYTDAWSSETAGADAFTPLALAAVWRRRLRLGTAIVPVFTRGPALIAQSAATLAALAPGRFSLGLGASSPVIVEQWNGIAFDQPYAAPGTCCASSAGRWQGRRSAAPSTPSAPPASGWSSRRRSRCRSCWRRCGRRCWHWPAGRPTGRS